MCNWPAAHLRVHMLQYAQQYKQQLSLIVQTHTPHYKMRLVAGYCVQSHILATDWSQPNLFIYGVIFYATLYQQIPFLLGVDARDTMSVLQYSWIRHHILFTPTSCHPPSTFLLSGSPLMMSWKTRTSAPIVVLDWLILSACKSLWWGPGIPLRNYAKHITDLELWHLRRMKLYTVEKTKIEEKHNECS